MELVTINGNSYLRYGDTLQQEGDFVFIKPGKTMQVRTKSEQWLHADSTRIEGKGHSLFVYSDIVESHPVDNAEANLLRVKGVPAHMNGRMVSTDFTNPMYYNLSRRKIRFVKVFIADELGREIPFEQETMQLTLVGWENRWPPKLSNTAVKKPWNKGWVC